jgi:hypothetical protein
MFMHRRSLLLLSLTAPFAARAHHGWSSFDQERPLYLAGTLKAARWSNPHAEMTIEVSADLKLPADLTSRPLPAQSQNVDGARILKNARVPTPPAGEWTLELAPLFRMNAWGMRDEPRPGARVEAIGYAGTTLSGRQFVRVEYLWVDGKAVGLRSSPA